MSVARILPALSLVASLGLASCSTFGGSSSGGDSSSNTFRNLLMYGGTTVPPSITEDKDIICPLAMTRDGGAVMRNGKGPAVSSQLTIRNVVRECAEDGQGGLNVKVGIEGIAVIGTAGKAGPVGGPIIITVDRDGKTLSTRTVRATANIGADGQTLFTLVEDGIKVPPGDGETVINVGFKN